MVMSWTSARRSAAAIDWGADTMSWRPNPSKWFVVAVAFALVRLCQIDENVRQSASDLI